jgi:hypothetical protein
VLVRIRRWMMLFISKPFSNQSGDESDDFTNYSMFSHEEDAFAGNSC